MGYGRNASSTWHSANVSTTLQRFSVVNSIESISQTSKACTTPLLSRPAIDQLSDLVLGTPYLLPWTLRSNGRVAAPRFPNGAFLVRNKRFRICVLDLLACFLDYLLSRSETFHTAWPSHAFKIYRVVGCLPMELVIPYPFVFPCPRDGSLKKNFLSALGIDDSSFRARHEVA